MAIDNLENLYSGIRPDVSHVYVVPSIPAVSKQNPYLQLFYKPIENSTTVRLSSTSRLSPAILWKRFRGEKNIVHHHWFECHHLPSLLNMIYKVVLLSCYRLLGGKLVWTVHNVSPHHKRYRIANRLLRRVFSRLANKLHVHCASAVGIVAAHFAVSPEMFSVIPHPLYPVRKIEQQEARRQLIKRFPQLRGRSRPIVLMQGYLAAYKGVLQALALLQKEQIDLTLIVAGPAKRYETQYVNSIRTLSDQDERIILLEGFLEQADLDLLFNSVDYVLLNYQRILHSGGAVLAESYGKQIIAPRMGCLQELDEKAHQLFSSEAELMQILKTIASQPSVSEANNNAS